MTGQAKFPVALALLHDALRLPLDMQITAIEQTDNNTFTLTVFSPSLPAGVLLDPPQVTKHIDEDGHATFTWKFGPTILFRE